MKRQRQQQADIGAHLRATRERLRITKEEAAAATGAQVAAVSAWERGTASPTLVQLRGLLECYGVSCHQLLFGRAALTMSDQEASELVRAARDFSPGLRAKVDVFLTLISKTESTQAVAS